MLFQYVPCLFHSDCALCVTARTKPPKVFFCCVVTVSLWLREMQQLLGGAVLPSLGAIWL